MNLLFMADANVAAWTAARIPHMHGGEFGPCKAIGVVSNDGKMLAGVIYHDYQPTAETIQLSMAADSPRWARKGVIRGLLHYPFEQIGVQKLWTATPHTNERAIRFNKGIGFTQEAVLAHHFGHKKHAVICRMLKVDYEKRYARNELNGEALTLAAASG